MGTLRVTGGALVRRRMPVPPGAESRGLRPTSDRVREAVFSKLGFRVEDAFVVDAFAGTGILGIEALSRGAAHVVFIDRDRVFAAALKKQLALFDLSDRAEVRIGDAAQHLRSVEGEADFVFLDPPYDLALAAPLTDAVHAALRPSGCAIVERRSNPEPAPPWSLRMIDERVYGSTRVTFYGRPDDPDLEEEPE